MSDRSVLIVEDNRDLNIIFTKYFTAANYEVSPATTLANARIMLQAKRFHVVVIDMRLPDGDGIDLLHDWWEHLRAQGTAVIVVTAEDQYEDACRALGVEFFLTKPVAPSMLLALAERLRYVGVP